MELPLLFIAAIVLVAPDAGLAQGKKPRQPAPATVEKPRTPAPPGSK